MRRLIFVIFAVLILSGCARRYIVILDSSSSQRHSSQQIVVSREKERPKIQTISFDVNFLPMYGPPIMLPVNQGHIIRPAWYYF